MQFQNNCLGVCTPPQLINLNYAFNFEETNTIKVYNKDNCEYNNDDLEFAYSIDNICWSCYVSYQDLINNTINLGSDFYLRIKVSGVVNYIEINGNKFTDYKTSLVTGFTFKACDGIQTANQYNPYINMECAMSLYQQMTENVSCMFGIPIYYFKLSPNKGSKDITFKEYTLMDIDSVKQIKMLVNENQMPSSKPEFAEFGFEFQNDWETEISKGMFATAFGNTAQPTEGDIIWVPMMKRMWMINEAYEEKKDAFMWYATTFKLSLVKYQEKGSVDLGETEGLVNSFIKNKYDDLFGDDETLGSGYNESNVTQYTPSNLYAVYESDATRKYVSVDTINIVDKSIYQKGTLISDLMYSINNKQASIVYQTKYCGDEGSFTFIICPQSSEIHGQLFTISNIDITYKQTFSAFVISIPSLNKSITLKINEVYFVYLRWSKKLNICELSASIYKHVNNIPLYKLQTHHYYFDIDKSTKAISKYNIELICETKKDIIVHGFKGLLTNIKLFNIYIDDINELLQMYPTNNHLIINDTARKILDLDGISNR